MRGSYDKDPGKPLVAERSPWLTASKGMGLYNHNQLNSDNLNELEANYLKEPPDKSPTWPTPGFSPCEPKQRAYLSTPGLLTYRSGR